MKYLAITCIAYILILNVFVSGSQKDKETEEIAKELENNLKDGLDEWRKEMSVGYPDKGVPPTDPFHFKEELLRYVNGSANVTVLLSEGFVRGASSFTIKDLNVDLINQKLTSFATFPSISLDAQYETKGTVFKIVPIYGKGTAFVRIHKPWLKIVSKINVSQAKISIEIISVDFDWENLDVSVTGLFGGGMGDAIQGALPAITKFLFQTYRSVILKDVGEVLSRNTNQVLDNPLANELAKKFLEKMIESNTW